MNEILQAINLWQNAILVTILPVILSIFSWVLVKWIRSEHRSLLAEHKNLDRRLVDSDRNLGKRLEDGDRELAKRLEDGDKQLAERLEDGDRQLAKRLEDGNQQSRDSINLYIKNLGELLKVHSHYQNSRMDKLESTLSGRAKGYGIADNTD